MDIHARVRSLAFLIAATALLTASSVHAFTARPLLTPTGAAASDDFGCSVGTAGDVNGDGYADVIVGAFFNDAGGADAGRAYVYYGGPGQSNATADLTLTGAAAGDRFGVSVGTAGDVNRDGFADLIVGAYNNDAGGSNAGRAYVYYGGTSPDATADLVLTGAAVNDFFGWSVGAAGDVNGDGYADLIVGAYLNDAGGADAGRAYVYYGGSSPDAIADLTLTGAVAGDRFGVSVGTAGDVNGDGYADLIAGAHLNDQDGANAGRAYVYYGGAVPDAFADLITFGAAGDNFGSSVGTAGDFNGDGYSDLIVGTNGIGKAYVYYGRPGLVGLVNPDLILASGIGDWFGISVGTAGDVNGDGFDELIIGAQFTQVGALLGAGRAYVYYGAPVPDIVSDLVVNGLALGDQLGNSVGTAGDVNGDGYADVIAGAISSDVVGTDSGRAYVMSGRPFEVVSPDGGEQWAAGSSVTVRWLGHDLASLALSVDGGSTWSTLASAVGGAEANALTVIAPGPASTLAMVRVSESGQPVTFANSDLSDGVFRIVLPDPPPAAAHRLQRSLTGAAAGDNFAVSVGTAGDVNGDGYDDQIVGAYNNDAGGANAGQAYVYYGGPGADAIADLTLTGAAAGDAFGYSVGTAGDVNGDGFADVIVGAYGNDAGGANAGRAYVYYGGITPDATADLTLTGAAATDNFGISVGTAGNFNGDGYADVIVGAVNNDGGGNDAGRAYVYYGGPSPDATADLILTGVAAGDFFGNVVGTAGDVNGDGNDDVIVGADFNAVGLSAGRAHVYYGGPAADAIADLTLTGAAAGDQFGISVGTAGDVNGDGYADVIVGAFLNDAGGASAGRAYVYHGGPTADATADLILTGAAAGDQFGYSVGTAGDINGDDYADVIVGAYLNDASGADAGRGYVYYGGPGADATADIILTGAAAGDRFGVSVLTAGDVNRDGYADLIVGASRNDAGGADAGRAYIYECNRYFVLAPNDDEVWNVGAAQTVSWLGAEPADLWLSVDGGSSYDRLQSDVGGGESNDVSLLVPHAPTRFARVRVTPTDLSVRGADESDSLFTIQTSVALLSFAVSVSEDGGAELSWSTDPGVGPQGLAGYRLFRLVAGATGTGERIGPDLIVEPRYLDPSGTSGITYRLTAVNGLQEELELGRLTLTPRAALAAWPLPYRRGDLTVSFAVSGRLGASSGAAEVGLYDVSGRLVKQLARGDFSGAQQIVRWDGRNEQGGLVGNGLYFLLARSGGEETRLKVVVAR